MKVLWLVLWVTKYNGLHCNTLFSDVSIYFRLLNYAGEQSFGDQKLYQSVNTLFHFWCEAISYKDHKQSLIA